MGLFIHCKSFYKEKTLERERPWGWGERCIENCSSNIENRNILAQFKEKFDSRRGSDYGEYSSFFFFESSLNNFVSFHVKVKDATIVRLLT